MVLYSMPNKLTIDVSMYAFDKRYKYIDMHQDMRVGYYVYLYKMHQGLE